MLFCDENNQTVLVDSITGPVKSDYCWVLDLKLKDHTLMPIQALEEVSCPCVTLMVSGFEFTIPTTWCVLVYDEETTAIDVVEASQLAGRNFSAFVYGPTRTRVESCTISVTNYTLYNRIVSPSIGKHQMLCHPIGPTEWICISPYDGYKHLKNAFAGDII